MTCHPSIFPKKIFVLALVLFLSLLTLSWAENAEDSQEIIEARQEFESRCPRPKWWDRVSISGVEIYTYDDLLRYWQNNERTKSQFFKAAYTAILDYPLDVDIVVNAIKLMYYADRTYPHMISLQEYVIERYFSYNSPYGELGDTVSGVVENLAKLYNRSKEYDKSIELIERLLREREDEINDHMLELIHLEYAEALHGLGRTVEAVAALSRAVEKYDGSWEERLIKEIKKYEGGTADTSSGPSIYEEHVAPKESAEPEEHAELKDKVVPREQATPKKQVPVKKERTQDRKKPWWSDRSMVAGLVVIALLIFVLRSRSEIRTDNSRRYQPPKTGTDADVERLVIQRRKIEATKLYRQIHNVGLKEAKEAVDEIVRRKDKNRLT